MGEMGGGEMQRVVPTRFAVGLIACESSAPARPPPRYPPPFEPGPAQGAPPSVAHLPERSREDISAAVTANTARFSDCYRRSESFVLGKSGTATIFFDIAQQGQVVRATDVPPPGITLPGVPLADRALHACLTQGIVAISFNAARDATAASWTFQFSP